MGLKAKQPLDVDFQGVAPVGISLVELSKRLGKNRGTISRAAKEGRIPRLSDGTFDFDEVVSHLRKTEDPARYGSLLSEID